MPHSDWGEVVVSTMELRIGDIWNGKMLIRISPPPRGHEHEWSYMLFFTQYNSNEEEIMCEDARGLWLVHRRD